MRGKKTLKLRWQNLSSIKGFTLVEVLISVFIGVIVLSVLYASFFQIIKAKDTAEGELEFYHEARSVLSTLREDLEMAYPRGEIYSDGNLNSQYSSFIGKVDGENSSVSFTSLSREIGINSKASDQAEISYYLEPIPESDLFFLMKRESAGFGTDSAGIQYAISERVVGFKLAYVQNDEGEPTEDWDSTQSNSLPRAVEVTLIMRSPKGEDVPFNSLILIPVTD
jgi:general secretion pathway protein J